MSPRRQAMTAPRNDSASTGWTTAVASGGSLPARAMSRLNARDFAVIGVYPCLTGSHHSVWGRPRLAIAGPVPISLLQANLLRYNAFSGFGTSMPIYEYRCNSCGHQQEFLQRMSDAPLKKCPECGKRTFNKMLNAAGFQLKGTGWYATDFKNNNT